MPDSTPETRWQVKMVRAGIRGLNQLPDRLGMPELGRIPWLFQPIRPADIVEGLREAMLDRDNMLEDVNYQKVIPNRFVVQVAEDNYHRQFVPIEANIVLQWRAKLLEDIMTANSRQGRKEFRLSGPLQIEVKPTADLKETEARILSRIEPDSPGNPVLQVDAPPAARPHAAPPLRDPSAAQPPNSRYGPPPIRAGNQPVDVHSPLTTAYLEMVPDGQWWTLYSGINTIGRSELCQIYLNLPIVQEKRLISGQHAYVVLQNGVCSLYDGSPDGRPSANGTYVNMNKIPASGHILKHGDSILLAALNPLYPRLDTPGVVSFLYWTHRKD